MTVRYTIAAAFLLVGILLVVMNLFSPPQVTAMGCSETYTGPDTPPERHCTKTTSIATGQLVYVLGIGAGAIGIGYALVFSDQFIDRI
ncbi:hypothetical protein [Haladaptatus caseinilyticus]|uniref:hypothetical protein n=1 Tax=Haladaptatus caseinilyticus TaxID=2993314 RepID=UPI00224B698E|nr:hypothetical protein [Haladaptatus caseinilyticus]